VAAGGRYASLWAAWESRTPTATLTTATLTTATATTTEQG
jgi:hypothetical protein